MIPIFMEALFIERALATEAVVKALNDKRQSDLFLVLSALKCAGMTAPGDRNRQVVESFQGKPWEYFKVEIPAIPTCLEGQDEWWDLVVALASVAEVVPAFRSNGEEMAHRVIRHVEEVGTLPHLQEFSGELLAYLDFLVEDSPLHRVLGIFAGHDDSDILSRRS